MEQRRARLGPEAKLALALFKGALFGRSRSSPDAGAHLDNWCESVVQMDPGEGPLSTQVSRSWCVQRMTGTGLGRVKSQFPPLPDPFTVIPAQAGIQRFQALALDPRFRGGDEIGRMTGFHTVWGTTRLFVPKAQDEPLPSRVALRTGCQASNLQVAEIRAIQARCYFENG